MLLSKPSPSVSTASLMQAEQGPGPGASLTHDDKERKVTLRAFVVFVAIWFILDTVLRLRPPRRWAGRDTSQEIEPPPARWQLDLRAVSCKATQRAVPFVLLALQKLLISDSCDTSQSVTTAKDERRLRR